jgi:hypothetical protein
MHPFVQAVLLRMPRRDALRHVVKYFFKCWLRGCAGGKPPASEGGRYGCKADWLKMERWFIASSRGCKAGVICVEKHATIERCCSPRTKTHATTADDGRPPA